MLISLCIPNYKRDSDLAVVMPTLQRAAAASPPVEIAVHEYEGDYYHMAKARNQSVLASHGEYIVISSTDIKLDEDFFVVIRNTIEREQPDWIYQTQEQGVLTIRREEFIQAGGFDERFEYYGSEDRDLFGRLQRRGGKVVHLPRKMFYAIGTPDIAKVQHYRGNLSKGQMIAYNRRILLENVAQGVLVANSGDERFIGGHSRAQ